MSEKPPQPLVQAFVVCRLIVAMPPEIELALIAPLDRAWAGQFPGVVPLAAYAHLTGGLGRYEVTLHLVDREGRLVWRWPRYCAVEVTDPDMPQRVVMRDLAVAFPDAGRYDLILVVNGAEIAHQGVWACQAPDVIPPPEPQEEPRRAPKSVATRPAMPLVQAYVVCREIRNEPRFGKLCLIQPTSRVRSPRFPVVTPLSVYGHLADLQGRHFISLQLRTEDGEVVWTWPKSCGNRSPVLKMAQLRRVRFNKL